jgi:hypothetical protein
MTLNQIISLINSLGTSHAQIKTVRRGSLIDALSTDVIYPIMNYEFLNSTYSGNTISYSIQLFFLDRVTPEGSNSEDVLSDQLNTCLDIISELRNPSLEVELQDPATINFVEDTIPDLISGVVTTLTIEQLYVTDRCAIPKI